MKTTNVMAAKSAGYLILAASLTWGAVVGLFVYGLGDVPYNLAIMRDERDATSVYVEMAILSHDWGGNLPVIAGAVVTAAMLVALPTLYCAGALTLRVWRLSMTYFAPSPRARVTLAAIAVGIVLFAVMYAIKGDWTIAWAAAPYSILVALIYVAVPDEWPAQRSPRADCGVAETHNVKLTTSDAD